MGTNSAIKIKLGAFTEALAKEVCQWQYEGIYSVYNLVPWQVMVENHWQLANEESRKNFFYGIFLNDKIIGFGRIQPMEDHIDLGIGLKPDLCGKGYGQIAMEALLHEAQEKYPGHKIGLEVRQFNTRAIRCYENVGFTIVKKYMKETINGYIPYAYMIIE